MKIFVLQVSFFFKIYDEDQNLILVTFQLGDKMIKIDLKK